MSPSRRRRTPVQTSSDLTKLRAPSVVTQSTCSLPMRAPAASVIGFANAMRSPCKLDRGDALRVLRTWTKVAPLSSSRKDRVRVPGACAEALESMAAVTAAAVAVAASSATTRCRVDA